MRWPGRARFPRPALLAALVLLLAAVTLLAFMASRASGPRSEIHPVRHSGLAAAGYPAPPSGYARTLAPASQRVRVRFNLPLRSGLLFDVRSGHVLWQLDPGHAQAIASLTKMMTALVVVSRSRPSEQVLVTPAAIHYSGSGVGLLPLGKQVPLETMLYGLLLPSGNDAAIALAQHVAGTRSRFIAMMNVHARGMGLSCTHFNTVSGIVDEDNYSCATDLAIMAHAVLEDRLLGQIVASRSAVQPFPINGGKLFLYNNNPLMLQGYRGTDGVKTGYTNVAGQCLVAAARRGQAWLAVVLLHSADPVDQAEKLLDAGFKKVAAG